MPYSWDDENDYSSSTNQNSGHSFKKSRKSYDSAVKTTLQSTDNKKSKAVYTFKSQTLETKSKYPIIIGIDTTGSMAEWPKIFFEKLPLLYKEAIKYFPDCEISFQAINDYLADGSDVALQPTPFGKGPQLDELITQLYPVGGGGGNGGESYEIFALYNSYLKAEGNQIKPIAIILGDEPLFESTPKEVSKHFEFNSIKTKEIFKKLHEKCDVYLIRKPYYGLGEEDEPVIKNWIEYGLMKRERIINIEEPKRVVDVILGILSILTNKTEIFEKELIDRQNKDQVKEVLTSIHNLQQQMALPPNQKSITKIDKSNKTQGLKIDN